MLQRMETKLASLEANPVNVTVPSKPSPALSAQVLEFIKQGAPNPPEKKSPAAAGLLSSTTRPIVVARYWDQYLNAGKAFRLSLVAFGNTAYSG